MQTRSQRTYQMSNLERAIDSICKLYNGTTHAQDFILNVIGEANGGASTDRQEVIQTKLQTLAQVAARKEVSFDILSAECPRALDEILGVCLEEALKARVGRVFEIPPSEIDFEPGALARVCALVSQAQVDDYRGHLDRVLSANQYLSDPIRTSAGKPSAERTEIEQAYQQASAEASALLRKKFPQADAPEATASILFRGMLDAVLTRVSETLRHDATSFIGFCHSERQDIGDGRDDSAIVFATTYIDSEGRTYLEETQIDAKDLLNVERLKAVPEHLRAHSGRCRQATFMAGSLPDDQSGDFDRQRPEEMAAEESSEMASTPDLVSSSESDES